MKPSQLAKLLNVSGQTVRRWGEEYSQFLSNGAAPATEGQYRSYNELDQRIILLVAQLRNMGQPRQNVIDRLEEIRAGGWEDLPPLPESWLQVGDQVSVALAAARANELAAIASLQTQLQHVTQGLTEAQNRAQALEHELEAMRADQQATEASKHALEVDLARTRGEVARLEGLLSSYSLGGEKPVNIGLIIAAVALITVLLTLVVLIVAVLAT